MPYIPPEVVEQARQIDLLTYLQSCEPQELVRISGNNLHHPNPRQPEDF